MEKNITIILVICLLHLSCLQNIRANLLIQQHDSAIVDIIKQLASENQPVENDKDSKRKMIDEMLKTIAAIDKNIDNQATNKEAYLIDEFIKKFKYHNRGKASYSPSNIYPQQNSKFNYLYSCFYFTKKQVSKRISMLK